jgi:hypothetical protein
MGIGDEDCLPGSNLATDRPPRGLSHLIGWVSVSTTGFGKVVDDFPVLHAPRVFKDHRLQTSHVPPSLAQCLP